MDCANEDAYHAVCQNHCGYRNPDNRIHGNGNRTFYRSKNPSGRYDQRHGHNQTRTESHFHGTNNSYQNLRKNSAGDDRPQIITSTDHVNSTTFDKVPPAITDKREAQNAEEVTAENGVCPKETADSVSAGANFTTTVNTSSSRPTSTSSMPNVWKDRQDFCRGVRPNTAEEEEEMLRKALEMSKLDELERRSEIDEEDLRSLPSLTFDVGEQEEHEQASTTSPADDDPAIFEVVSSSTFTLPSLPSSDAETTALLSAVVISHPHEDVSVSRDVKEDWDAECIEIEVHRPQLVNNFHCPTNFDDLNPDSTVTSGGCNPSTTKYELAHSDQAFPASSHLSENASTSPAALHPSCSVAYACSPVDHITQTDLLPTSADEWSFSASGLPLSCSSTTESRYQEPLHAVTDCDVDGMPSGVEPNVTANQDSNLPFNDSSTGTVIMEQFSPSLNHTSESEPFHQNPEPPFSGSHTTIEPSYFYSSEQSSFHRVITTSPPPGFKACSPSGIALPDEPEESGFTFTFTDTEQFGYRNHPLPERNFSISPNEHESPCNFSESERSANSSVSFPSGETGILQDTTAVDEVMNYIPDQQQLPANEIRTECHCEKNASPPAYASNPFGTICGHGFPPGHVPFLCPPLWTGHPHLMPALPQCSMPYLPYAHQLGYPVYPGGLPYVASPYSVLPPGIPGLPGLGPMPGVIPGYFPLQHPMQPVISPFAMTRPFAVSQPGCSCGSDQSCVQVHSAKPCD